MAPTYLTTYPDQTTLIPLLEYYGFAHTASRTDGEMVFEKPLSKDRLTLGDGEKDVFTKARINYPRFIANPPAKIFCVPIRGD